MVYAAQTKATDNAITVGAYNNKPLVPIRAFKTVKEMRAELDKLFVDGYNLIRVSAPTVVGWFGRDFQISDDGRVVSEWDN